MKFFMVFGVFRKLKFEHFLNFKFLALYFCAKAFLKKKRHVSKTTKIWAVLFGGKIHNTWIYLDSLQLQGKKFSYFDKTF